MKSLKIHDKVMVLSGNHKGETAKIVKVDRKAGKACLEGIGTIERHMKKSYTNPTGGKKTIHVGIDLSNLKLVEAAKYVKSAVKKVDNGKNDKKASKAKKGAK